MSDHTHPTELELAAFVDGGLDREARLGVEAHLLECAECRALVGATGGLLASPPPRPLRRVLLVGGLAAAAALLLLTVVPRPPGQGLVSGTRGPDSVETSAPRIAPRTPLDGGLVRPDTLIFRWANVAAEVTYQLTISTEAGAIVWSQQTVDTSLALPALVATRMKNRQIFYWQVDAQLPDLRSASTPLGRFTVVAP